jgi:hypothetical protein
MPDERPELAQILVLPGRLWQRFRLAVMNPPGALWPRFAAVRSAPVSRGHP